MRSKLFVPGARPELFDKALASAADALSFDLEDSVPEAGKQAAREHIASFLALRVRTAMFAYGFLFLLNIIAALSLTHELMQQIDNIKLVG